MRSLLRFWRTCHSFEEPVKAYQVSNASKQPPKLLYTTHQTNQQHQLLSQSNTAQSMPPNQRYACMCILKYCLGDHYIIISATAITFVLLQYTNITILNFCVMQIGKSSTVTSSASLIVNLCYMLIPYLLLQ